MAMVYRQLDHRTVVEISDGVLIPDRAGLTARDRFDDDRLRPGLDDDGVGLVARNSAYHGSGRTTYRRAWVVVIGVLMGLPEVATVPRGTTPA